MLKIPGFCKHTHTHILFTYFVRFKCKHLLVSIYRSIDSVVNATEYSMASKSENSSLDYRPTYSLNNGRPLSQGKRLEIIADHSLPIFRRIRGYKIPLFQVFMAYKGITCFLNQFHRTEFCTLNTYVIVIF